MQSKKIRISQLLIPNLMLLLSVFLPYLKYPIASIYIFYLGVLLVAFGFVYLNKSIIRANTSDGLLLIILLLSFLNIMRSPNTSYAIQYVLVLTACLIFGVTAKIESFQNNYQKLIIFGSLISVISILVEKVFPDYFLRFARTVMETNAYNTLNSAYYRMRFGGIGGYTNVCSFNAGILFLIFFCKLLFDSKEYIADREKKEKRIPIVISLLIMIGSFYAIILTNKRGITVAVLIGVIVSFLLSIRDNRKAFIRSIVIIGILLIVFAFLINSSIYAQLIWERFVGNDGDFTTNRSSIYSDVLLNYNQWMLFGNGTRAGMSLASEMSLGGGVHNIYIEIFYDYGIIGVLAYIVWFLYNIVKAFSAIKTTHNSTIIYISLAIQIMFLVYGFVGNPLFVYYELIIYIVASSIPYIYLDRKSNYIIPGEQV